MNKWIGILAFAVLTLAAGNSLAATCPTVPQDTIMWLNHLGFLPGDPSVQTSFNAVNSGVGSGLSGLVITSTTLGEIADGGGNKVVEMGLEVPPWYLVKGVRVCYELTSQLSYISQIRISQLQQPPSSALVLLDDGTNLTDTGPVCIDSAAPDGGFIDPAKGGLRLDLRVNFGDLADKIVIRGVGLHLIPDPLSPQQLAIKKLIEKVESLELALKNHTHKYLTGKGVGHNNVTAITSPPFQVTPVVVPTTPVVVPTPSNKKK